MSEDVLRINFGRVSDDRDAAVKLAFKRFLAANVVGFGASMIEVDADAGPHLGVTLCGKVDEAESHSSGMARIDLSPWGLKDHDHSLATHPDYQEVLTAGVRPHPDAWDKIQNLDDEKYTYAVACADPIDAKELALQDPGHVITEEFFLTNPTCLETVSHVLMVPSKSADGRLVPLITERLITQQSCLPFYVGEDRSGVLATDRNISCGSLDDFFERASSAAGSKLSKTLFESRVLNDAFSESAANGRLVREWIAALLNDVTRSDFGLFRPNGDDRLLKKATGR